jgi:hypothetical protein
MVLFHVFLSISDSFHVTPNISFFVGFIYVFYCQENAMVAAKKRNQIEDGFSKFPKDVSEIHAKYIETRQE